MCMMALGVFAFATPMWIAWAAPAPASSANSARSDQERSAVVDWGSILDDRQERSAEHDAQRLNLHGIPTQVVTEAVALDQAQADARANELRIGNGVESAPGADDGLLIYVSVDRWDQRRVVMSISTGSQALPRNGLNAETMEAIRTDIVAHQLSEGRPARAIVYSLREMIYLEQYVPPPTPPVSGWQAEVRLLFDILAPILTIAGCSWLVPQTRRWVTSATASWSSVAWWGIVAIAFFGLAISTRSSVGALSAILLGGTTVWRAIQLDRQALDGPARRIVATPRVPGARTVTYR